MIHIQYMIIACSYTSTFGSEMIAEFETIPVLIRAINHSKLANRGINIILNIITISI